MEFRRTEIGWISENSKYVFFSAEIPTTPTFRKRTHTKCHRATRWMDRKQFINCRPWHLILWLWLHCCASQSRLTSSLISSKLSEFFFSRFASSLLLRIASSHFHIGHLRIWGKWAKNVCFNTRSRYLRAGTATSEYTSTPRLTYGRRRRLFFTLCRSMASIYISSRKISNRISIFRGNCQIFLRCDVVDRTYCSHIHIHPWKISLFAFEMFKRHRCDKWILFPLAAKKLCVTQTASRERHKWLKEAATMWYRWWRHCSKERSSDARRARYICCSVAIVPPHRLPMTKRWRGGNGVDNRYSTRIIILFRRHFRNKGALNSGHSTT